MSNDNFSEREITINGTTYIREDLVLKQKNFVKIHFDKEQCDSFSPRECDNIGTMVCWHDRYNLGDVQTKLSPKEYLEDINGIVIPLYLYDHSGIAISTGQFSCKWDSGQVGYIYATYDKIRKEFNCKGINKAIKNKVIKCLESEVEIYNDYIQGYVYWFEVNDDSCSGFIGSELKKTGLIESMIDCGATEEEVLEAWEGRFDNE